MMTKHEVDLLLRALEPKSQSGQIRDPSGQQSWA
jgi:hypothetical protein